jgi:hypothetical protein
MTKIEWIDQVLSTLGGVASTLGDARGMMRTGVAKYRASAGWSKDDGYLSVQHALDDAEDQLCEALARLREQSYGGGDDWVRALASGEVSRTIERMRRK